MRYAAKTGTGAAIHKPDTISIQQRMGVWRVALNDAFYGDYSRRYWAIDAAFDKADDIFARGGHAIITMAMDGEQDAVLYDTRPAAASRRDRGWPPRDMPPARVQPSVDHSPEKRRAA